MTDTKCSRCGASMPSDSKKCPNCGKPVLPSATSIDHNVAPVPPLPPKAPTPPKPPVIPTSSSHQVSAAGAESQKRKRGVITILIVGGCVILTLLIIALVLWLTEAKSSGNDDYESSSSSISLGNISDPDDEAPEEVAEYVEEEVVEEEVVEATDSSAVSEKYPYLGIHSGRNVLDGEMVYGDQRFPFTLSFDYNSSTGAVSNCTYVNVRYGTRIQMTNCHAYPSSMRFLGKDGKNDFSITVAKVGHGRYSGSSTSGSQTLRVVAELQ
ncbi:MAG: zinc ribbon domain-containing protein [Muribaculum sp.]|nr:zinc ribbon domain-containing protein [Muribaculum sp.]